jgi:rod shape-determining protein MreC
MALADIRSRPGILFGIAVVFHVILISAQLNTTAGVPLLQSLTFGTFAEVQRASSAVIDGLRNTWSGYLDLRAVRAENAGLRQALNSLEVRLQEEHALARRTDNLRQLLELRERSGLDTVAAEIIAGSASPEFRTMTIDKGAADGLAANMAVISPAGVVGRIILSSSAASKLQLLIDRNAAAGALIERTRVQGIVTGIGDGTLHMQYVPGTADVKTGDLIVTSGIDGIYPKGFVIGTIDGVERGHGPYHEIVVKPAVDATRLEEVLVVRGPERPKELAEGGK